MTIVRLLALLCLAMLLLGVLGSGGRYEISAAGTGTTRVFRLDRSTGEVCLLELHHQNEKGVFAKKGCGP